MGLYDNASFSGRSRRTSAPPNRASRTVRIVLFFYLWLVTGFAAGTATLLGPVRWVTTMSRSAGWQSSAEAWIVRVIIAFLVLLTAAAAGLMTRLVLGRAPVRTRLGVPVLLTAAAGAALVLWMNPRLIESSLGGEETTVGSRFTFGPYPTAERMDRLKQEQYTAIISLLHPAVVPFEPKLLADEKALAATKGLELIHVPLLPWVSENAEGLETLRTIARSGSGRYYVHCYLGRDRVHLAKRVVEQAGAQAQIEKDAHGIHRLVEGRALERGAVASLGDDAFLTPYPTDEEFMTYVLGGEVHHVVSLLDPTSEAQRQRIEAERALLARYSVPFEVIPLSDDPVDERAVLDAVRRVRAMDRPIVVHAFFGVDSDREPAAKAFLEAWRSADGSAPLKARAPR